jgi:hypothetical protein
MSAATDQSDRSTLERVHRDPPRMRRDIGIVKASVERLIRSGHIVPPGTNGKLYPACATCGAAVTRNAGPNWHTPGDLVHLADADHAPELRML